MPEAAITPPLWCSLLVLCLAWIAYRGERDRWAQRIRALASRPSDSAAQLAALIAQLERHIRQLAEKGCAIDRAAQSTRKPPEPLPGTQRKPVRETKPDTRKRERKG